VELPKIEVLVASIGSRSHTAGRQLPGAVFDPRRAYNIR
jgi:hypothetical protein